MHKKWHATRVLSPQEAKSLTMASKVRNHLAAKALAAAFIVATLTYRHSVTSSPVSSGLDLGRGLLDGDGGVDDGINGDGRIHRRGFKSSLLSTARGFGKRSYGNRSR